MSEFSISIGLPVYNGGSMINECLDCLASQTHGDFSVLISDNASTDGTSEICASFAANDSRFIHVRHDQTTDPTTNFFFARENSPASDLFMWRAHDDLSNNDSLERLLALFESEPEIELAVSTIETRKFDSEGNLRKARIKPLPKHLTASKSPLALWNRLMKLHESSFYGLWKRQVLIDTFDHCWQQYPYGWASDHLTLLPLILDGTIRGDGDAKFTQRIAAKTAASNGPPEEPYALFVKRRTEAARLFDEFVSKREWTTAQALTLQAVKQPYLSKRVHSYSALLKRRRRQKA